MMCIHGSQYPCQFGCIRYTTSPPPFWFLPWWQQYAPQPQYEPSSWPVHAVRCVVMGDGWLCPECKIGVAPSEKVCPRCVEKAGEKKEPA